MFRRVTFQVWLAQPPVVVAEPHVLEQLLEAPRRAASFRDG
jgi:hypothetical protein